MPAGKKAIVAEARKEALNIEEKYNEGLLSDTEGERMTIEIWNRTRGKIEKIIPDTLVKTVR